MAVGGGAAAVLIVPGPAHVSKSYSHGSGLSAAVAGRAAAAVVRAFDEFGNPTMDELLVGAALRYAAYAPGFVIYATKFPKNKKWGYHEWFHISVLMGNLVSMGFDLGILGLFKPCAEGVACASLASRLTFGLLP